MCVHPGGARADGTCSSCHGGTGSISPILDVHRVKDALPTAAIPAIAVDALSLTATRNIQIDFTVTVNGTPRDILASPLTSLSAIVAGPTTDYLFNTSFTLTTASQGTLSARNAAMGQFRWVSTQAVEAIAAAANADVQRNIPGVTITASGTWAVGMQATLRVNGTPTATACSGTSTTTCNALPLAEGAAWACVSSACTPGWVYPAYLHIAQGAVQRAVAVFNYVGTFSNPVYKARAVTVEWV